ncbi:site-specific integrase [Pseudomonas sp. JS3066]|uniref:site-specific integrase n=1 Tax=Pseudomonas sp. JS3066 TaxID=3090665 RepID=UPI002E7BF27E|nr:site-specific integrase [Pseudomonas sp. JS3066]WVK92021.1 site-specific integrase [Pseudomonas sp. JS3066]
MGATDYVDFSDAAIRRAAADEDVRDLRDARYPGVRLRFRQDRRQGTWDVRHDGKWRKAGNWPAMGWGDLQAALPAILSARAGGAQPTRVTGALLAVGDLLTWHLNRLLNDRMVSASRRAGYRSMVGNWLLPRLGPLLLAALDRESVDRLLIQPMRRTLAPATVVHGYRMLVAAIHAAQALRLLPGNPLEGVKVSDFGLGPLKPKAARLLPKDAPALAAELMALFPHKPSAALLPLLMLATGARVGETRRARWADFDLGAAVWVIPAERTKTRTQLELPLSPALVALLRRFQAAQAWKHSVFLFPGERGQPLSSSAAQEAIRALSGGVWSSHDLRKMARAGWALLGVDYLVAELLLNHAMPGLSATYVQADLSRQKREALALWQGVGNAGAAGLDLGGLLAAVCDVEKS